MSEKSYFSPGQTIVLREIWQGRIWSARPEIVVQDKPDLLALYMPPGIICKLPRKLNGKRLTPENRAQSKFLLNTEKWVDYHSLRLTIPGENYSVLIFWYASDISLDVFYINLEDPFHRTPIGFDYMDQILDVIVKPDLSGWFWKDEDEFDKAIALGLISKERAAVLRAEGEKAARWLQSGKSPFNGWENWRPNPAWKVPVLPEGWDKI